MFSTEHWLPPKLDQLKRLLTDPLTDDEAQALLDVLYQRHWMRDLVEWLEKPPGTLGGFLRMSGESQEGRSAETRRRAGAQTRCWPRPTE